MTQEQAFWTIGQAIAWICTRDNMVVRDIPAPAPLEAFRGQMLRFAQGGRQVKIPRIPANGDPPRTHRNIAGGKFSSSGDASQALQSAMLSGVITTVARDVATGTWGPICPAERLDLEFRVFEDPDYPYGFRSRTQNLNRYVTPLVSRLEIQRLWPAPVLPRTVAAEGRIFEHLLQITATAKLTKNEARERCKQIDGFFGRAFDRAWAQIPAGVKPGRGQHGPRRPGSEPSHPKSRTK